MRQQGGLPGTPRSLPSRIHQLPGGLQWTAQHLPGWLRPELFPGIGVLPGPATESHIVKRGTPVAPLGQPQLNVPERKSHLRGKPLHCGPDSTSGEFQPRTWHRRDCEPPKGGNPGGRLFPVKNPLHTSNPRPLLIRPCTYY